MIGAGMGSLAGKAAAAGKVAGGMGGAASAVGGALKGVLPWFAFGAGTRIASNLTGGLTIFLVAALFDFLAFILGNSNLLLGLIIHAFGAFILLTRFAPGDGVLKLIIYAKIAAILLLAVPSLITIAPEVYYWIGMSVANHAFPVLFLYIAFTGFIFNRGGGKIATAIYLFFFFLILALAYVHADEQINEAFEQAGLDISSSFPEQENVIISFVRTSSSALRKTTKDFASAIVDAPSSIRRMTDTSIGRAGGEDIFGDANKAQPKYGIVIEKHPSGAVKLQEGTTVKALLTLTNPPKDRNYVTVSNVRCFHEKSTSIAEVGGQLDITEAELLEGFNVFYNRPRTVSCFFTKEQIKDASSVTFAAEYDLQEKVELATYFMENDLLEEKLIKGEEPFDLIDVDAPSSEKKASIIHDNGPARLGIGPIELQNPPLGIAEGLSYPDFEFAVGNNIAFSGKIKRINNIVIKLPPGVSLGQEKCGYANPENEYVIDVNLISSNRIQYENIKTSRLFTCPMLIDADEALQGQPFAQADFSVDVDFTYETEKSISTK
ncbi:hypothetical protein HYX10_05050 [Candidatus Woesearchaeota archaeon]|nr:hypothetical protein [Candidatus Woesearchaeota archaeon]